MKNTYGWFGFLGAGLPLCIMLVMVAICLSVSLCCEGDRHFVAFGVPGNIDTDAGESFIPDVPDTTGGIPLEWLDEENGFYVEAVLFGSSSFIGENRFVGLLSTQGQVSSRAAYLFENGFDFEWSRSLYLRGTRTDLYSGSVSSFEFIGLVFSEPAVDTSELSFAVIHCVKDRDLYMTFQLEKIAYAYDPFIYWGQVDGLQVENIGITDEGIPAWSLSYEKDIEVYPRQDIGLAPADPPPAGPDWMDWKAWILCVASRTASGCELAGAKCLWSDDGYLDCAEEGCAKAAVSALVGCSF